MVDAPMISTYSAEHRAAQINRTPLGRVAEPDDIASVACFLVSRGAARHMNGEVVIVNGGVNFR
jgi:3-oxoacyl-[acyl-carrier protein] reductase